MKTTCYLILICLLLSASLAFADERGVILEDFESSELIELFSYADQDSQPDLYAIDSLNTISPDSKYSLKLYGNTWKYLPIPMVELDTNTVWQVASFQEEVGDIQGFGVMDSVNNLLYSLAGQEMVVPEDWNWVYQGAYPDSIWNTYRLPVGDDWLAQHGYLPEIEALVFINDMDVPDSTVGIVYFDDILDITEDLPIPPILEIGHGVPSRSYENPKGDRVVDVSFYSEVFDPDSDEHQFLWHFGDDSTSTEPEPFHTYLVEDDHPYTVRCEVVDSTELKSVAVCQVLVDDGASTFPITMNFTGDVMLARRYEEEDGVIETMGVEAIFEPTLDVLGNAADITVANLECPLSDSDEAQPHPSKSYVFRGAPENVTGLVTAGIDVVSLANNHTTDFGLIALQETQAVLDSHNILYSGSGANSYEANMPLFYSKSGINFAFIAACDRTGQYSNNQPYLNAGYDKPGFANETDYDLLKQIEGVEGVADFIIAELHSGYEYEEYPYNGEPAILDDGIPIPQRSNDLSMIRTPRSSDVEQRHLLIDNGVDVVIGHHPHVLQGMEVYNGKLIAHSLGNFAFDQTFPETFPSVILNAKVDNTGFYQYSITPIYIDDYIPKPAQGELGIHILEHLADLSRSLGTYLIIDKENITADVVLEPAEMEIAEEEYQADFEMTATDTCWVSNPIKLEHSGSLAKIADVTPAENQWLYRLGREMIWWGNFEDEGCTLWELDGDEEIMDDEEFYEGNRSLRQECRPLSPQMTTHLEKRIKCDINKAYTVHGYIKTDHANNATINTRYYWSRTSATNLGTENIGVEIDGTTDWTYCYNEMTLPEYTQYFNVRMNSTGPVIGTGHAWFDNIGVIEWTEWKSLDFLPEYLLSPNDYYYIQLKSETEATDGTLSYIEYQYDGESSTAIGKKEKFKTPNKFKLYQNYPNPFNPTTTIAYNLPEPGKVKISVYSVLGQLVEILVEDERQEAGYHAVKWDASAFNSGVYFYKIDAQNGFSDVKKCVILK